MPSFHHEWRYRLIHWGTLIAPRQDQSALIFLKNLFVHRMTSQSQDICKLGCHVQEGIRFPEVKIWTVNSMAPAMAQLLQLSCSSLLQKATQQLPSPSHRSQGQMLARKRSQGQSHQGSEAPDALRFQRSRNSVL